MEFCIVQSVDTENGRNKTFLSVMPSQWVIPSGWNNGEKDSHSEELGDDLMYWPYRSKYHLILAAEKNSSILPDPDWCDTYRCIIKRKGFRSKKEATRQMKIMDAKSDTEQEHPPVKKRKGRKTHDHPLEAITNTKQLPSVSEVKLESDETVNTNNFELNNVTERTEFEIVNRPITNTIQIISKDEARHQLVISKLNSIETQLQTFKKSVLNELTKMNAKLDLIGSSSVAPHIPEVNVVIVEEAFQPVSNIDELVQLNERAKNSEYVKHCIETLSSVSGRNENTGNGWNTALRTIDKFFLREFLTHCTWTGVSRQPGLKYSLSEYKFVINLFEQVIFYSDNTWTSTQNVAFLKSMLNNSSSRYRRDKGLRTPSARPSRVKKQSNSRIRTRNSSGIAENASGNVENLTN